MNIYVVSYPLAVLQTRIRLGILETSCLISLPGIRLLQRLTKATSHFLALAEIFILGVEFVHVSFD